MTFILAGGKVDANPTITRLIEANKKRVNPGSVYFATAACYAIPKRELCVACADEPGSGQSEDASNSDDTHLGNDGLPDERQHLFTKQIVASIDDLYPQGPTRHGESWSANERSTIPTWLETHGPYYFGPYKNGNAYPLGTVHTLTGKDVSNIIYDYETTNPALKGRALLDRMTPFDLG